MSGYYYSDESSDEKYREAANKCECGRKLPHDWENEEYMNCVPPEKQLKFGGYELDVDYKAALYAEYPFYTTEEVMGSYFGHNPYFPSQEEWLEKQEESETPTDFEF